DPPGDGQRDHHRGLRGGGDRRTRLFLGRRCRCPDRRPGEGAGGRSRLSAVLRGGHVSPDAARPVGPPARPVRRAHPAVRVPRPMPQARHLLIAAGALVVLPFALTSIGLGVPSATEVVVFAIACMALNILVGYTGLTSFGHGAWFGLAAYAAGLAQRNLFPGAILLPVAVGLVVVAVASLVFGYVILRRRGVYFSLLTLALAAMLYTIA